MERTINFKYHRSFNYITINIRMHSIQKIHLVNFFISQKFQSLEMKVQEQKNINNKKSEGKIKRKVQKVSRNPGNKDETVRSPSKDSAMIQNLLSPDTAKLMSEFSNGQRKVIEKQFLKMIKKIHKQLGSPQKNIESQTQRLNLAEYTECNSQTARKGNYSDRNLLSPKKKTKNPQNSLTFVSTNQKKTKKNWSILPTSNRKQKTFSQVKSPLKPKMTKSPQIKYLSTKESHPHKRQKRQKRQDIYYHEHKSKNYFLFGDQFVKLGFKDAKNYEEDILHQKNTEEEKDSELQDAWKKHLDSNKRKQRIQSAEQIGGSSKRIIEQKQSKQIIQNHNKTQLSTRNKNKRQLQDYFDSQKSISINDLRENSDCLDKIMFKSSVTPFESMSQEKLDFQKKFQKNLLRQIIQRQLIQDQAEQNLEAILIEPKQDGPRQNYGNIQNLPELNRSANLQQKDLDVDQEIIDFSEGDLSPIRDQQEEEYEKNSKTEDALEMRTNVVKIQMKTNKQILDRLFQTQKITKKEYQGHLDTIMEKYSQQMNEIDELKQLIDKNEEKVEQIIQETRQNLKYIEKIMETDPKEVLQKMFKNYKKEENGICKNQLFSQQVGNNKISSNCLKQDSNGAKNEMRMLQQRSVCKRINILEQQRHYRIKYDIDERVNIQLGVIPAKSINYNSDQINTSVPAIYQFIQIFFRFLLRTNLMNQGNYRNQFLRYINSPYGYSVSQRLAMMQGYEQDDDAPIKQDEDGILYGIEDVLQPEYFERFFLEYMTKMRPNPNLRVFEKIHANAIFDAINESVNQFRPYYQVNGAPYLWSTSEKALTFYYISEDNITQVLDKAKIDVLKHASSFCGVMISSHSEGQQKQINNSENQIKSNQKLLEQEQDYLEHVFEKYTSETCQQLLKDRENRLIKLEKRQIQQLNYQWSNFDEYRTALFYQISSLILEEVAEQITLFSLNSNIQRSYIPKNRPQQG